MGRIGRLIQNTIEDFIINTVETRLGYNQDVKQYSPAGVEGVPLADERILCVKIDGSGKFASCGVLNESHGATEGDLWLFSRDADGNIQAVIKLINDGTISIDAPAEVDVHNAAAVNLTLDDALTVATGADCTVTSSGNLSAKADSGTVEVGNGSGTLGAMISELLGYLAQLKTVGSPASHTADPGFIANIQALKAKWEQVFK